MTKKEKITVLMSDLTKLSPDIHKGTRWVKCRDTARDKMYFVRWSDDVENVSLYKSRQNGCKHWFQRIAGNELRYASNIFEDDSEFQAYM